MLPFGTATTRIERYISDVCQLEIRVKEGNFNFRSKLATPLKKYVPMKIQFLIVTCKKASHKDWPSGYSETLLGPLRHNF